ncbi:MAG: pyrophosphate-energized proton pump, K(+)-stimulated pyrophosphate-energized sodium pump [Candidatus Peregrinibacteria bacterium GW2011_GWF2_33_10]|nr:MAG: pyrophosphate-energized proton pump, K(+)-stimulated pyrophosphate-energized sodium pump [Candidatus Peregrinibacteria bacterium GW2011_GWF2_33_10]OGJ44991.1 MAG: sodium-translocating pyrophosphatase [Candidatus Peregrinibacteria bacterium RIFOXYA2_FULL_33_21]OGJ47465.1 MAG: sodium-translocating pyrophosphatase [Candidatus Peregrinibacteria bacterium RIFOXYA12_FULL_33_12]OGJ50734.1 MAG: sodium-translocating pyrophosphatase [Candidatus Peregrinibacteria bacterium RIFOXYB2_FULL_33_20]
MSIPVIAIILSLLSLAYAIFLITQILKKNSGTQKMQEIAAAIEEGAMAFIHREYKTIAIFAIIIFLIIGFSLGSKGKFNIGYLTAISFLVGAILSALAGYIGMRTAVKSNVRTTHGAKESLQEALSIAVKGGSVSGLSIAGLGLLGLSGLYYIYTKKLGIPVETTMQILVGLGFGASLVCLFARVAGGIYTKAADVGADLVGKVEAGIPEDDPRNPAVIADNVGDNVGDCAGMAADLFETYIVTSIAAMLIGVSLNEQVGENAVVLPLIIGAISIIASIIATFFIKVGKNQNIMKALYKGITVNALLSAIGFFFAVKYLFSGDLYIFLATLIGLAVTGLIFMATEYYTSTQFGPVRRIAKASETGAGTNIIIGLGEGMLSVVPILAIIVLAIIFAYIFGERSMLENGVYGIAIASVSMLSMAGMIVTLDSYGPITDNAGGIAEMAELPESVRKITDALDAVGNTTKAVTKGFAIGSAALAAVVLMQAYKEELVKYVTTGFSFDLTNPAVLVGLFIGSVLPFIFSSVCMTSVGKAANTIVEEVRRQFREIAGIMEGKAKPDYAACVDIVTKAALKQMIVPGIIAVLTPILVGFIFGPLALAGLLVGVIVSGFGLAVFMSNTGGAWDNAKKYIEGGEHGGKGSAAHKAAVTGDTVGDPFKDTAGPALNALIKVINTVALIIAPLIATIKGIF